MQVPEKKKQIAFLGTEQYRAQLQQEALNRGIKVQSLLEQAVDCYLAAGQTSQPAELKGRDPSITPKTEPERRFVTALLACIRDKQAQILLPVLTALLGRWLPESAKKSRKPA